MDFLPVVGKRGDTLRRTVTISADGAPLNLTGATVTLHLRAPGATEGATTPVALAVTDAANGKAEMLFLPAATAALALDEYEYEIEVAKGADVLTATEGLLIVLADRG